jgi:hypothetical protein
MVMVTLSETYDLSTITDRMSLIGVHTPKTEALTRQYPGLLMNCKTFRYVSCDVTMACASMLPADPLQVGVEAGQIAPSDMFNPILYTAVSNDSMSTLESRMRTLEFNNGNVTARGPSVEATNDSVTTKGDWDVYYGLLSSDGFKHAMPQAGLQMTNLRPIVFEKYYNGGSNPSKFGSGDILYANDGGDKFTTVPIRGFRGQAHPMPAVNCTAIVHNETGGVRQAQPGFDDDKDDVCNGQISAPYLPPVYVAMIVVPPAKLNRLYYRMVVRWHVDFAGIRPLTDIASFAGLANQGQFFYHSDYDEQSTAMSAKTAMVDVQNADIEKVMEGS